MAEEFTEVTITKGDLVLEDLDFLRLEPDETTKLVLAMQKELERKLWAAMMLPKRYVEPTPSTYGAKPRCNCRGFMHRTDCRFYPQS